MQLEEGASLIAGVIPLNNPGNIKWNAKINWIGQIGRQGAFVVFRDLRSGTRACMINARSHVRQGYNTPYKFAHHWAPKSDNNQPLVYAGHIAKMMDLTTTSTISPDDVRMRQLALAIGVMEHGWTHANILANIIDKITL